MALKNTLLRLLRLTPRKNEELEDAEIDEATRLYSSDKADLVAEERFGMRSSEFEDDQDGPPH